MYFGTLVDRPRSGRKIGSATWMRRALKCRGVGARSGTGRCDFSPELLASIRRESKGSSRGEVIGFVRSFFTAGAA